MIERLAGPRTHIGWTPDFTPIDKREMVSLVREADLAQLEAENQRLREKEDIYIVQRQAVQALAQKLYDLGEHLLRDALKEGE